MMNVAKPFGTEYKEFLQKIISKSHIFKNVFWMKKKLKIMRIWVGHFFLPPQDNIKFKYITIDF